jgi:hypothetical protein
MPRPRAEERQDWPQGLREPRPGYFTMRLSSGREMVIGRVGLEEAIRRAKEPGAHVNAGRPRKDTRAGWPGGLREPRPGYFTFRYPSGDERAIGRVRLEDAHGIAKQWLKEAEERLDVELVAKMKRDAFSRAKTRARLYERTVMTDEEFERLWERADGRCELTKIKLRPRPPGLGPEVHPWTASVDRIDRWKGYEFSNCRIVCAAVNLALNQFGEEVLTEIARHLFIFRVAPALEG